MQRIQERRRTAMAQWGALWLVSFAIGFAFSLSTSAQEKKFSATEFDFFENKIRPILVEHCLECHGAKAEKIRGGLDLTSRAHILNGGDSGPAMVVGKPEESLLIEAVEYEDVEMPPDGKLDDAKIALLKTWIKMGAPDPRNTKTKNVVKPINIDQGRKFWAFQPVIRPKIPNVKNPTWARSEIDRFILAELESKKIKPSNQASRTILIRRAYMTLIGLPPTIKQIDQFVSNPKPTQVAFAEVIDQLLASRHFGERWGRHWLDVVRFAESSGGGRSLMFKDAWRYRDYVIDAYNQDRPFDQFVKEQIAGDLLPANSHEKRAQQIVATGLLALGPTNYEQQDKVLLQMEVIDEQIDTIGRAFMGMTLGCARCHDHKFDPIPTSDYYALVGIFKSTQSLVHGNVSTFVEQSISTAEEEAVQKTYRAKVASLTKQLNQAKKELQALGGNTVVVTKSKTIQRSAGLVGIVIDDRQALKMGEWQTSTSVPAYVDRGYLHDRDSDKGKMSVVFQPKFKRGGNYEVRLAYSHGGNRASNVPVTIDHQDGKKTVFVNQSQRPPIDGLFISLGKFRFEADTRSRITISTKDTDGHVIVDALQLIHESDWEKTANTSRVASISPESKNQKKASTPNPIKKLDLANSKLIADINLRIKKLNEQLTALKKSSPKPNRVAMSVREHAKMTNSPVHIRGEVRNHGEMVPRGFVTVCSPKAQPANIPHDHSGRLELAEWLTSRWHPLTARVYVNRIWRHMFGVGLVATPDNFGEMGRRPSHPELLDYLADEFVEKGWSTKTLIRMIMLSQVYQLESSASPNAESRDPQNRWLGRAHRRRLDAEVLRDSILAVSGKLDLTAGGLTIRKITQYDLGYEFATSRRSVYVPAFRNSMLDFFEVFDFANPNLVVGHRNTSTLPTQSLFLLNNPKVIQHAESAAKELLKKSNLDDAARIEYAYRQVLGRKPTSAEMEKLLRFVKQSNAVSTAGDKQKTYAAIYHVLFCSLDFRYLN